MTSYADLLAASLSGDCRSYEWHSFDFYRDVEVEQRRMHEDWLYESFGFLAWVEGCDPAFVALCYAKDAEKREALERAASVPVQLSLF